MRVPPLERGLTRKREFSREARSSMVERPRPLEAVGGMPEPLSSKERWRVEFFRVTVRVKDLALPCLTALERHSW